MPIRPRERADAAPPPWRAPRPGAAAMPGGEVPNAARPAVEADAPAASANGKLRLGTYRSVWAAPEVEISPALKFTVARQLAEISPEDARRLGIGAGDQLVVSQNGTRLTAEAHVRTGVPAG